KALKTRKSALQVIQTAAGDKFPLSSPDAALLTVIKEKIMSQNLFFLHSCRFRHLFHEAALRLNISVKRQHILLGVIFVTVVHLTVHVYSETGDHHQIPVKIHQNGTHSALFFVFHHYSSGHGKRSVEDRKSTRLNSSHVSISY